MARTNRDDEQHPTFATASDLIVAVQASTVDAMRRLPREAHNPAVIGLIMATRAINAAEHALAEQGVPPTTDDRVRLTELRRQVGALAGLSDDDVPPAFRAAFR